MRGESSGARGLLALTGARKGSLVRAARDLVPLLAAEADESERLGRLTDISAAALRDAGFLSLFAPRHLGGLEADLATAVEVFAELGRGCGSSAWVAALMSGGSFLASLLGGKARQEVWDANPRTAVCGGFGPADSVQRVPGGFVVSGRWQPLSGIHHASWAIAGLPLADKSGVVVDQGLALFPVTAGRIERTWHVAGMQGTGSDTLVVDEIFVPDHRVLSFSRLLAGENLAGHPTGSIYTASVIPFVTATLAGPLLGMADAALRYTKERFAQGKPMKRTVYGNAADSPGVRFKVADAALRIETARLHTARAIADVERGISTGTPLDETSRARVRMDVAMAARASNDAVRFLLDAGGSSSFALSRPIQRIWRNVEVASRHQLAGYDLAREIYARSVLGTGQPVTAVY